MSRIARLPVLVSFLALSLALLTPVPPPAGAQDQACDNLISLPAAQTATFTISAPGIYCLATDVIMAVSFTSGNAIQINANYVTLDLNGHKVHGAAAGGATQAVGIFASGRRNITIKNGTVWGFSVGIQLSASSVTTLAGYVIDGVRAELNRNIGINLAGANGIVRNSVVANTGPTTSAGPHDATALLVQSHGGRVLNNDILTVTPAGGGSGFGIFVIGGAGVLVVGNRITTADNGVVYLASTGKYRDNLTSDVGTPFTGGTNAGNNN